MSSRSIHVIAATPISAHAEVTPQGRNDFTTLTEPPVVMSPNEPDEYAGSGDPSQEPSRADAQFAIGLLTGSRRSPGEDRAFPRG
jgi:hypothetical protein